MDACGRVTGDSVGSVMGQQVCREAAMGRAEQSVVGAVAMSGMRGGLTLAHTDVSGRVAGDSLGRLRGGVC